MRIFKVLAFGSLAAGLAFYSLIRADEPIVPVPAPPSVTAPEPDPSGDFSDKVVAFYKVLLQKEPPTIEQENAIFYNPTESRFRGLVVVSQHVPATEPVILQLFRKHKDIFFPKNTNLDIPGAADRKIIISGSFNFIRDLEQKKGPQDKGFGHVLVIFARDAKESSSPIRSIVFTFGDGEIIIDTMLLDGYEGKMLSLTPGKFGMEYPRMDGER